MHVTSDRDTKLTHGQRLLCQHFPGQLQQPRPPPCSQLLAHHLQTQPLVSPTDRFQACDPSHQHQPLHNHTYFLRLGMCHLSDPAAEPDAAYSPVDCGLTDRRCGIQAPAAGILCRPACKVVVFNSNSSIRSTITDHLAQDFELTSMNARLPLTVSRHFLIPLY